MTFKKKRMGKQGYGLLEAIIVIAVLLITVFIFLPRWIDSTRTATEIGKDTCSRIVPGGSCKERCEDGFRETEGGLCPKKNDQQLLCCEPIAAQS